LSDIKEHARTFYLKYRMNKKTKINLSSFVDEVLNE